MADLQAFKEYVKGLVMARVDGDGERRKQALEEFLAVTVNPSDEMAGRLAELVPPLVPELYEKWAGMFADRLAETLPPEQIDLLSEGSTDNEGALVLAFLMFLESERMEAQMDADLAEYGRAHTGEDMGDMVAEWLRARKAAMSGEMAPAPDPEQ